MTNEQNLIDYIRNHANKHYESGWHWIVESWSDGDILEALSDNNFDLPKTMKFLKSYVSKWNNFVSEVENTHF